MRIVPGWTVLSATLAPILLIGGWTVAAALQPAGYDSARDTISALAGLGATDRAVMTAAFVGVGLCHLVTASGLRPARAAGRIVLGLGGAATLLLAAFPVPAVGVSDRHRLAAGVALGALAIWPALAARPGGAWALRPAAALGATAVLLVLLAIFAVELTTDGGGIGLTERLVAGAQALWPLVVVLSARRSGTQSVPAAS